MVWSGKRRGWVGEEKKGRYWLRGDGMDVGTPWHVGFMPARWCCMFVPFSIHLLYYSVQKSMETGDEGFLSLSLSFPLPPSSFLRRIFLGGRVGLGVIQL